MPKSHKDHKKHPYAYNRIKEVLDERKKTQGWLAARLDVDYVTVNRYANNYTQPSIAMLFTVARALGVSPKDLLNDDEPTSVQHRKGYLIITRSKNRPG
jgi:transcriptional regulator with XRE-family HTH domain